MTDITCTWISTCLPNHLEDRHERKNERLIQTNAQLLDDLNWDYDTIKCQFWASAATQNIPLEFSDEQIKSAISNMVDGLCISTVTMRGFQDRDCWIYIYARLSW